MRIRLSRYTTIALLALAAGRAGAQLPDPRLADTVPVPPMFASEVPLTATLTINMSRIKRDRDDKAPWRDAVLAHDGADGKRVQVPVRVRTRGIWRLKNCQMPPMRLSFRNKDTKGTIFHRLEKPKLVNVCRDADRYDDYLLRELQLYRAYRLLTPISHRVRLVRLTFTDSASGKAEVVRWAIIVEDVAELARRVGGKFADTRVAAYDDLSPRHTAVANVFQYMVGNTDFSFTTLHNSELIQFPNGDVAPVAYDFDFSGAVDASYATVDPRLRIRRVRDRQFRGFCGAKDEYPAVIALFQQHKDAIYALYGDAIGSLLAPGTARETLAYVDAFYEILASPTTIERRMLADCIEAR